MSSSLSRRSLFAAAPLFAQAAPKPLRLPRKIRIALIGLAGHTGEILGPLPQLPDVSLVAVSDSDAGRLQRFARRPQFSGVRRYDSYQRLLENEELDVAAVCTDNGARAAAVLACLDHGLNVAAEKPLALSLDDLARIRRRLGETRLHLTMLLGMRFSPHYLALRDIVTRGEIGDVLQISAQKSYKLGDRPAWMRHRSSYGGTIPWIGIHMIDLMRWSSGREFREVFSYASHIDFPEIGDMENVTGSLFHLDNQGVATLRMDYLRPATAPTHGDDRLRLAGTRGVVEYQAATGLTLATDNSSPHRITDLPAARQLFPEFLASIYLSHPAPISTADIFRVTEVTLTAQLSATQHKPLAC